MKNILALIAVTMLLAANSALAADKGVTVKAKTSATQSSSQPRRLALVVGNSAYRHSGALANPARDAELMAKTLKGVGFQLVGGGAQTDLSYAQFNQAVEAFGDMLHAGDVALFYYSGHGLQVAGENYLVPVDANIKSEGEIRVKAVPVNLLFAKLDAVQNGVNIVVLDACRNNPFARSFRSSGGGLAQMNAPNGTLVAFSTAPGQVAEDGSGRNSAYTAALAKHIQEPGILVEQVFKRVRFDVSGATKGVQTPWENTSLTGNFKFIDGDALALKKAALKKAGAAKQEELEALLKLEAEAKKQKEKEQAEIGRREAEVAKMDAEIAAMRQRLGAGNGGGNDSLQAMLAMVEQKEAQAEKLEVLRKQREAEEAKRQAEIAHLKEKQKQQRQQRLEKDIEVYQKIVSSPYGKDMADAAWASLLQAYPQAIGLNKGEIDNLREIVIEGASLDAVRLRPLLGEMVLVNGGCFPMGSDLGKADERPIHEVCVDDFMIASTEVTQGQWTIIMGGNPSFFANCGSDCPVENVSWDDTQEFIRRLNQRSGKVFRLPTEAEWEYAARSGRKNKKNISADNPKRTAWYNGNSGGKTHPVGQKSPNRLGLFDMTGNVSEWCLDWYDENYYADSSKHNPVGPTSGSARVKRGGNWNYGAGYSRESNRGSSITGKSYNSLGFRLVLPKGF